MQSSFLRRIQLFATSIKSSKESGGYRYKHECENRDFTLFSSRSTVSLF